MTGLHTPAGTETKTAVPLCVDLDGTLLRTDMVWESLVRLLKHNPLYLFVVFTWLLRGRAHLKAQVSARVSLDVTTLPYNQPLIEFLRAEKREGRSLILATASDFRLAQRIADHLGFFDEVLASDGKTNLRGRSKVARLSERFGRRGFDYAGNSSVDLPVWEQARQAIVVGGPRLAARAGQRAPISRNFEGSQRPFRALVQALRPHQWVKNLIVFVPLIMAHELGDAPRLLRALLAFVAFSLCASAVYVLNDLLDLESDRHHPTKRHRPFAAGDLPLFAGLAVFPFMFGLSAILAWQLGLRFAVVLGIYVVLTTSYSLRLKEVPLLDVFCLAGLYAIRLIAGHEATPVEYSFWLLVFSMFIFLSLALMKRFTELLAARQQNRSELKGRGYSSTDLEVVATLGTSSGYLAVLVLALYVHSEEVFGKYEKPMLLLLICPLLLYWISRVWMLAHRGQMHDDPIVFTLKDRVSYVVGALTLLVLWLAAG
jgi:4-hydroxybenzoate polyprenyltransferase